MSFIRAKEIPPRSGNWYDYEVETIHKGSKVIQKHIRYIGKSGTSHALSARGSIARSNASRFQIPDVTCKHCDSQNISRYGKYKGEQMYWCKDCEHKFLDNKAIPKMKTPAKQIASAMGMYYGGMSLDAIQQQFKQDYNLDMSESNYWNWVKRFTKEAIRQSKGFKPEVGDTWVADETYMKLGDKAVYFWDIIDPKTNYLLATHVSFSRGGREARTLMKLASQRAGKSPKTIVTDKLRSYIVGIEDEFGADTKHVQGRPFKHKTGGAFTAVIERFHKTLEQRTKVFEKFKDISSIKLLTDGWLINYNFFKQNEGCGNIPPAQAASKLVPFKDWNDIVRPESVPDMDYQVSLYRRKSVKKDNPVLDATLTPVEIGKGG
ncbi:MAG: DDE-type integrase/transposase/recombinase [Dehalococcoidales bacterium]|nr:DDE-type integrase/transposase/recombinase [Dehalococcoidales bacterium]